MSAQSAADILERHNKWRRGEEPHAAHTPREIGQAIDVAVAALNRAQDSATFAGRLARHIFECGDDTTAHPATRVEFKGGRWPHTERSQGGLNEVALARTIFEFLTKEEGQ